MTSQIDFEQFMPRGYTIERTDPWVITDPAVGTNIPVWASGPVDIYVTWEGETDMALVLINSKGVRRTVATGKKYIEYTLGARAGDMITITGASAAFPASDSNKRGTLKLLPMATP